MTPEPFPWPQGQRCAVSLTYDDGLPVHYEVVAPLLEDAGLRATFYVMGTVARHAPERWRALAAAGHELGSHSLFHPCRREPPENYAWLPPYYDLCDYTPERWGAELDVANLVLHLIDGKTERTFGNTCCNTTIGRGAAEISMDALLRERYVAARGPMNYRVAMPQTGINLMQVGHFQGDGRSFADIRAEIQRARDLGGWIVWMTHGVGAETHHLSMDPAEHEHLIRWLGANQTTIWTAPLVDVAKHVRQTTAEHS